jgi:hypothetical protein
MNDCRDMVFPTQINLNISKRLKSEEDRNRLVQLKEDIFNDMDIKTICSKHNIKTIKDINEVNTLNNIAYFNYYADDVNKIVHKKYGKNTSKAVEINGIKYYPGLEIVCKTHYKSKSTRLFVNYVYIIKTITKNSFTICEPVEDIDIERNFPISTLTKHFRLAYANTCHSVQGMSIDKKLTIFSSNIKSHVDRHYFWTALTRATDFNNVQVFIHNDSELNKLRNSRLNRYFTEKIQGYKNQDTKKHREITNQYIDTKWLWAQYRANDYCSHCYRDFEFDFDEDHNMTSNLSVDREDNSKPHDKSNCVLSCVHCNVSKH